MKQFARNTVVLVCSLLLLSGCGASLQTDLDTVRPVLEMVDDGLETVDIPEARDDVETVRELLPVGQAALEALAVSDGEPHPAWTAWVPRMTAALGQLILTLDRFDVPVPCWMTALATVLVSVGTRSEMCPLTE